MTSLDFYALPWYKKILVKIAEFLQPSEKASLIS